MAVKAKETVHNNQFSTAVSLSMAGAIIVFVILYEFVVRSQTDPVIQSMFSFFSMVIMLVALALMIRYMSTIYNLLLTHARLEVERKVLFFHHIAAEISVDSMMGIWPKADFDKMDQVTGKKHHFTVSRSDLDSYKIYVILYKEDDKINYAELQCSKKMHRALTKLVNQ
ncbi:MAG: hypothetical protein PHI94_04355 [Eubacteriaceae bacterium]|nr:hypothetical protein [Eubacteriaceae bacterium]